MIFPSILWYIYPVCTPKNRVWVIPVGLMFENLNGGCEWFAHFLTQQFCLPWKVVLAHKFSILKHIRALECVIISISSFITKVHIIQPPITSEEGTGGFLCSLKVKELHIITPTSIRYFSSMMNQLICIQYSLSFSFFISTILMYAIFRMTMTHRKTWINIQWYSLWVFYTWDFHYHIISSKIMVWSCGLCLLLCQT